MSAVRAKAHILKEMCMILNGCLKEIFVMVKIQGVPHRADRP